MLDGPQCDGHVLWITGSLHSIGHNTLCDAKSMNRATPCDKIRQSRCARSSFESICAPSYSSRPSHLSDRSRVSPHTKPSNLIWDKASEDKKFGEQGLNVSYLYGLHRSAGRKYFMWAFELLLCADHRAVVTTSITGKMRWPPRALAG